MKDDGDERVSSSAKQSHCCGLRLNNRRQKKQDAEKMVHVWLVRRDYQDSARDYDTEATETDKQSSFKA